MILSPSPASLTGEMLQILFGVTLSTASIKRCQRALQIFSPPVGKFWESCTAAPGLYIILTGKVRLLDSDDDLILTLAAGQTFGEATLFPNARTTPYSAWASLDVQIGWLAEASLRPVFQQYPAVVPYLQGRVQPEQETYSLGALGRSPQPPISPIPISPIPRSPIRSPTRSPIPKSPIPKSSKGKPRSYFPTPQNRVGRCWYRVIRRYPFYAQQSSADCGAACLVMTARYWGKTLSLNRVRDYANVSRSGASLKGLAVAAEQLGFAAKPVKVTLKQLTHQTLPAIAHWEGKHYILVYEVRRRTVIVADPALGQKALSYQAFLAGWTGYTLLLQPTSQFDQIKQERSGLWHFLVLLKPHQLILFEIFITSFLIQIFGLMTPIFTQLILDRVVVQRSELTLTTIGLGLLIFSLFRVMMTALRQYLIDHTANRLDLALIVGFIRHCLTLPLPFFDARYVGDIVSRVQENRKVQRFLSGEAMTILLDGLTLFIYIGLMVWYSWQMALFALVIVPPFVLLALISTPFLQRISREIFTAVTAEGSYLIEVLTGIGTIKASAQEQTVRWHWEGLLDQEIKKNFSGQMISNQLQTLSNTIQAIATTGSLWFGAQLVIDGKLTIGQLVAFNLLLGNVLQPFQRLTTLWNQLQEVLVAVERINDVLEASPEEASDLHRQILPPLWGHLQFEQVTFRYHPDQTTNTLENLSFQVYPGQMVALVGRSGSGKTTISKLLLGLYAPNEGKILIDGHDLSHIALQSFRQQIGIVDQDTFMFGGTIRENIALGATEASLAEVVDAAKLAGADAFIQRLPLGYETPIGEGGGSLSGGQRQRLAIARALLGNPRLLIFDEATSHLDTESERLIQANMSQILQGRTTLVIAHRLTTIRQADLILVLDHGRLVEQGTHEELMSRHGPYYLLNQ